MVTPEGVEGWYVEFYDGNLEGLLGHFRPDAMYLQTNTCTTAIGREEIGVIIAEWAFYLKEFFIEEIKAKVSTERLGEVPGAVQCITINFVGVGTYVRTLPSLEQTAPATNADVDLPMIDVLWLDAAGVIICVENTFRADALL